MSGPQLSDAASRITAIADQANAASGNTYCYDVLGRLISYINPTSGTSYTYDAVGNRSQKSTNGSVTTYSHAAASNRLLQAGALPIATDANGSVTSNTNNQFAYNARGRMISATTAIGLVQYRINALGQRIVKITPTETTIFHYDLGGKLIAESISTITANGVITRNQDYVYLGDLPVAVLK